MTAVLTWLPTCRPSDFNARCCNMKWSKRCLFGFNTFPGILEQPGVLGHQQSACRKDRYLANFQTHLFLSTFISQLSVNNWLLLLKMFFPRIIPINNTGRTMQTHLKSAEKLYRSRSQKRKYIFVCKVAHIFSFIPIFLKSETDL